MGGRWKGDSNPGGPGGRTRKIQINKARGKTSHRGAGKHEKKGCAVVALALAGGLVTSAGGAIWGIAEVVF